jgi:hypothetical protein
MLFQDIEHNIILSIKEESKVIFKTLNISEKVFFLLVLENIERPRLSKNIEIFYNKYFPI